MKKFIIWTLLILGVLGIIVGSGMTYSAFGGQEFAITGGVVTQIGLPRYGTAECVLGEEEAYTPFEEVPESGIVVTSCPGANCIIQIKHNFPQSTLERQDGIFINLGNQRDSDSPLFITTDVVIESPEYLISNEIHNVWNYVQSTNVFLQYGELSLLNKFNNGQKAMEWRFKYTPVRLRIENGLGQVSYQEGDCSLALLNDVVRDADYRDSLVSDPFRCTTNACELGGYVNWVDFWENTEVFGGGLVEYQNNQYFCASGTVAKLWEIGAMQVDSQVINYPIRVSNINIDCCDGQQLGEYTCVDFKWEKDPVIECFSDAQCKGQNTQWMTDYENTLEQYKYGCISSKCQITDRRTVECNEMNPCDDGVCKNGVCEEEEGGSITPQSICEDKGGIWISELSVDGVVVREYCKQPFDYTGVVTLVIAGIFTLIVISAGVAIGALKQK